MEQKKKKRELPASPHYANPSIAEALCEIHFISAIEDLKDNIKELEKQFQPLYKQPQKKTIKQYQTEIKDVGLSVRETSTPLWVFEHKDRNHLIQISPHMISINERYPGWRVFTNDLSIAWETIKKIIPITDVKRIGLRYINLIPRKNANEPLSQWLQPNRYYPDGILDSVSGFVSRTEFSIEECKRLVVTIAEASRNEKEKGFIFDIDSVVQINKKMEWKEIIKETDSLHDLISDVFFSSIAKKYKVFLNGEFS